VFKDIAQNDDAWLIARSGKVTGSVASSMMANYGKAFGDPAKKLAANIAVEQLTGKNIASTYSNAHMERGHEQEPIARMIYEDEYFCDVLNGGFFDNGFTGCSPDGLVMGDGVVEIKSVIASVQYATVKRGSFDPAYRWQLMFNLKETGRKWIDYISFCNDFPEGKKLFVFRIHADEQQEEFKMIDSRLAEFKLLVDEIKQDIMK
jgi:hypothetical protein